MAYPPGLELHGSSWRINKRVPQDLLAHYAPKKILRFRTTEADKKAAAREGWRWLAEIDAEFHRLRTTGSKLQQTIAPEKVDWLVASMISHSLLGHERSLIQETGPSRRETDDALTWLSEACRAAFADGFFLGVEPVVDSWLNEHGYAIPKDSHEYRSIVLKFAKGMNEAIKGWKARREGNWIEAPVVPPEPQPSPSKAELKLSEVIETFLSRQDADAPMFKKFSGTLAVLLEVWGDRAVTDIKQKDIDDFFALLCRLPPRWSDEKRKRKVNITDLAAMDWDKRISPKTFEDSYMAAFRPFLKDSIRLFGDQGFPRHLTTDGIKYSGSEKEGQNVQRAMTGEELKRLYEGPEFKRFAASPDREHCYWLPLIGLYTGARVNEVCQLNPQCDIREDDGIWFFDITEESEGDERIRKSVKNVTSKRSVPIHSRLIELGLLDYVERMKKAGHRLLFPQWSPLKGKASGKAEKWFREFLVKTGLRDDTPGSRVVGFHAYRHTFLNRAMHLDVANAEWLTGHAPENVTKVVRGYRGHAELEKKRDIMERVVFDVTIPKRLK